MLIIDRKRISFILTVLFVSVMFFSLNRHEVDTVQTVSLPVSNKVIILDAGHGAPDEGAFLLHKENKQLTFYKLSNRVHYSTLFFLGIGA